MDPRQRLFAKLAKGKKLDVGFAQQPNHYLSNVIGLDIYKIKKPKNYSEVTFVNLNKNNIPFTNEFFDTVLAGEVIEHLENPSHFLRECNRVLKKKGKLILSTPHPHDIITFLFNLFGYKLFKDPDEGAHINNWGRVDMIRLLRKNGFSVKKMYGDCLIIPFLRLRIPLRPFPFLSWIIIYECIKLNKPNEDVLFQKDGKNIPVKPI